MVHHAMIRGYLKPTPLKPYMTSDDHHSTSITMRKYKDKNHISHPQEKPQVTSTKGRGEEGQDGHITLGGPAKPGSYIRVCSYFLKSIPDGPSTKPCMPLRYILAQVKDKRFFFGNQDVVLLLVYYFRPLYHQPIPCDCVAVGWYPCSFTMGVRLDFRGRCDTLWFPSSF